MVIDRGWRNRDERENSGSFARTWEVLTQIKCLGFTFHVHWVNWF